MKTLVVRKRIKLSKGQQSLYDLILNKVETEQPIEFEEAKDIWVRNSCRDVRGGVPYFYDYWAKTSDEAYKPMSEWQIKNNVTQWLSLNIGILVLKGRLKVLPDINVEINYQRQEAA